MAHNSSVRFSRTIKSDRGATIVEYMLVMVTLLFILIPFASKYIGEPSSDTFLVAACAIGSSESTITSIVPSSSPCEP